MTAPRNSGLTAAQRRRRLTLGLLRAAVVAAVLVTAYFMLPLSRLDSIPLGLLIALGMIALVVVAVFQLRWVTRAHHPGIRAVQALAMTAPLFLLLFATAYFLMAERDPASFSQDGLTRVDTLYLTVTIFATVGFGDISPVTELARVLVTVQMILDLVILGLGIRVFLGAVDVGRQRVDGDAGTELDGDDVVDAIDER